MGRIAATKVGVIIQFQSTHPVWGGTFPICCADIFQPNFNPPTPCGVGPVISYLLLTTFLFQSTHPVWGGTFCLSAKSITIFHFNPPTPCGVGQIFYFFILIQKYNFNPPTPCGVGPITVPVPLALFDFNPPTPCGVGLPPALKSIIYFTISIHPPRVGWDLRSEGFLNIDYIFQSTHPVWGGTVWRPFR